MINQSVLPLIGKIGACVAASYFGLPPFLGGTATNIIGNVLGGWATDALGKLSRSSSSRPQSEPNHDLQLALAQAIAKACEDIDLESIIREKTNSLLDLKPPYHHHVEEFLREVRRNPTEAIEIRAGNTDLKSFLECPGPETFAPLAEALGEENLPGLSADERTDIIESIYLRIAARFWDEVKGNPRAWRGYSAEVFKEFRCHLESIGEAQEEILAVLNKRETEISQSEVIPLDVSSAIDMVRDDLDRQFQLIFKKLTQLSADVRAIPDRIISAMDSRFDALEQSGFGPGSARDAGMQFDTSSTHTPAQDRTVCFAGTRNVSGTDSILDHISDLISRKASRLGRSERIVPMTWDFAISVSNESDRGSYAQTRAWTTLDERVVGGVLALSQNLGTAIDPDEAFLDAIADLGWDNNERLVDVLEKRAIDRRKLYREGGIPITYESRFALECILRGKPLLVIAPQCDATDSSPASNFLAFLKEHQVDYISYVEAENTADWTSDFLATLPGVTLRKLPNPYRGLDYYQIDDAEIFVGREPEMAQALALLREAIVDQRGLLLGITGPSGSGKSSFLRARVAAGAQKELSLRALEFRPTDFRMLNEAKIQCLPHLCSEIASIIGQEPPEELVGSSAIFRNAHLPRFKKWLDTTIGDGEVAPVLICLDQFEEILDDLSEGLHEGEWLALATILIHLAKIHGWPIVFTLEDSRKDRFERLKNLLGFSESRFLKLPDADTEFYKKIITQPFQRAGIDLEEKIVNELLSAVAEQTKETEICSSPLPLLALRLFKLFDQLSPRAPKSSRQSTLGREFTRMRVARNDLDEASLALGDMVADLAETAWINAGGGNDPKDLGYFLRPLVRVSLDPKQPDEAKLVLQSVRGRGFRKDQLFQAEFCRQRVLVPSGGGVRLVHEAVIRRWPRARNWFDNEKAELESAALFRADALRWIGESTIRSQTGKADEEHLVQAAQILAANSRDWCPTERPHLDTETEALRTYAIKVFSGSRTPCALIKSKKPDFAHVHVAASYGLNDLLKTFYEIDANCVNLESKIDGVTPVGRAAWEHLSTVKLLLEIGGDPEIPDRQGFCALDCAIWAGNVEIVELLVKKVDVKNWGSDRRNPLSGAAERSRQDIAEMLTTYGFKHDQPTLHNWTPLHQAATKDDLANFRYFLKRGDLTTRWRIPARPPLALRLKQEEATSSDTKDQPTEFDVDRTPFHVAASCGCIDIVRHILSLEEGYLLLEEPGKTGETPLILASWENRYNVVEQLLAVMENPNSTSTRPKFKGFNALHFALISYHWNREDASEHLKRITSRTALALLCSPTLKVGAATADGESAWEMADGLPDLQQEIANHPLFPVELLEKLRIEQREKILAERTEKLFEAVQGEERQKFSDVLASIGPGENVDIKRKVDGDTTFLGNLMLEKDWIRELENLIRSKRIDPWRNEEDYPGLYGPALEKGSKELIASIERSIPATIPSRITRDTLLRLRQGTSKIADPEESILNDVISRISKQEINETLLYVARLGDFETYHKLVSTGADPDETDEWGRTALDVASDQLREAIGSFPRLGINVGSGGNSVFYPEDEAWQKLEDSTLVRTLAPSDDLIWDEHTDLWRRPLSFYPDPDVFLIRAKHRSWLSDTLYLYWLKKDDALFRLDGTSPPIHEFNAKFTLTISEGSAVDYLKFFCFFVRGEEGPFYIIDGCDAHYLPTSCKAGNKTESVRSALKKVYRGPIHVSVTDKKHHRISVLIYYGNAVFSADMKVLPSGMIEMPEDWPVISDLPDVIDAPVSQRELKPVAK